MFIDLHILQTIPFANLNRDDVGAPKTLIYGGAPRLRVSSQSWKRAARIAMEQAGNAPVTFRTRNAATRIEAMLVDLGWEIEDAAVAAAELLSLLGTDTKDGGSVILFAADTELAAAAELLNSKRDDLHPAIIEFRTAIAAAEELVDSKKQKKAVSDAATSFRAGFADAGIDKSAATSVFSDPAQRGNAVGMFGRMLAENPKINVDAAVQVAHAFSTHRLDSELDFFNAAEDLGNGEDLGGAHLGTAEFATGTLYRYASIDVDQLVRNCNGDITFAAELARGFASAFALSMPSGKKNATAPTTLPDLVAAVVRTDRPVSLADAFERPLAARPDAGIVEQSVTELDRRAQSAQAFVNTPHAAAVLAPQFSPEHLGGHADTMADILSAVSTAFTQAA